MTGMRRAGSISAILVAVSVLLTTVFALVSDGAYRGGVARMVRGGAQRPDSADTLDHDYDDPESVVETSSAPLLGCGAFDGGPPGELSRGTLACAPAETTAKRSRALPSPILTRYTQPGSGRAPPAV